MKVGLLVSISARLSFSVFGFVLESVAVSSHLGTFQIYSMDNVQCQVSLRNRVSARDFSPRLYLRPSRCKRRFRSCGRARRRIFARVSSSLLYNLDEPICGKPSAVGTFNPRLTLFNPRGSSFATLRRRRFFPVMANNNLKLFDAFLFTPTLLSACIKVCYYKNGISASRRVADSDARSKLSSTKCGTFKLVILNIAGHYPTRAMSGETVTYESQFARRQLQTLLS